MIIAGIDPGSKGAIVCIDDKEVITAYLRYSTRVERYQFLEKHRPSLVFLEKLWGVPPSSAATNFNLGCHYCCDEFALELLGIPYEIVAAKTWQLSVLNFRGSKKDRESKKSSISFVTRRYPDLKLPQKTLKEIDESSGIADALCIAIYGRRISNN